MLRSISVILAVLAVLVAITATMLFNKPIPEFRPHTVRSDRRAVVIGATGATGLQVVEELLKSNQWSKVTTITRREVAVSNPESEKLQQIVVPSVDEENLAKHAEAFQNIDTVFNCIGTTRSVAGSAEQFVKVEVGITEASARVAKENNVPHYSVVTAAGANADSFAVDWFHPLLYVKTLGQKQNAVIDKGFPRTTIFQPGMLGRSGHKNGRDEPWHLEVLVKMLSVLPKDIAALPVNTLAKAIVRDAETDPPAGQEEPRFFTGNSIITSLATMD